MTHEENLILNEAEIHERKKILASRMTRLMVVLTARCNLQCIMCERKLSPLSMPREPLEQIAGQFPYLSWLMWQGGEVFLVDYFREFFQEAGRYPRLTQEINTNGLLITEEWAQALSMPNVRLIVSIDATDRETYEHIRKGGRFETLLRNMKAFKEARQRNHPSAHDIINVVVMRSNYRRLESFVDFALGFGFRGLNFMRMLGSAAPEEDIFSPGSPGAIACLREAVPRIMARSETCGLHTTCDFASFLHAPGSSVEPPHPERRPQTPACLFPWQSLFIDAAQGGKVYPECMCRVPAGDITQDRLEDIWNNSRMQEYRSRIGKNEFAGLCNPDCLRRIDSGSVLAQGGL